MRPTTTESGSSPYLDLQYCAQGNHAFCDAQAPAECACSCHEWLGHDTGRDTSALYHIVRPGGPLDLMMHITVGTFMRRMPKYDNRVLPRIEHKSLRIWGIDGEGEMARRISYDAVKIRAFLKRFAKERNRGPKEFRLVLTTIWQSDRDKGIPFPQEHREPRRQRGQEAIGIEPEIDGAWPWI